MKSLTLVVGDIIGGNDFDTLFIAVSDLVYRKGSIYADISKIEQCWLAVTILMTGIILNGFITSKESWYRQYWMGKFFGIFNLYK